MSTLTIDTCCQNEACPCKTDGAHSGKAVFSEKLGGQFCCRRSYVRAHYDHNKTTYVARATSWNKENAERHRDIRARCYVKTEREKRDYFLRRKYGLSVTEYDEMVMAQCGLCAVCGEPETRARGNRGEVNRLVVHHNHTTGEVVALVCHKCNVGMGMFRDNPALMRIAADLHEGVI